MTAPLRGCWWPPWRLLLGRHQPINSVWTSLWLNKVSANDVFGNTLTPTHYHYTNALHTNVAPAVHIQTFLICTTWWHKVPSAPIPSVGYTSRISPKLTFASFFGLFSAHRTEYKHCQSSSGLRFILLPDFQRLARVGGNNIYVWFVFVGFSWSSGLVQALHVAINVFMIVIECIITSCNITVTHNNFKAKLYIKCNSQSFVKIGMTYLEKCLFQS